MAVIRPGRRLSGLRTAVTVLPAPEVFPVGCLLGEETLGGVGELSQPGLGIGIVAGLLLHEVGHGDSSQLVGGALVGQPDELQLEQLLNAFGRDDSRGKAGGESGGRTQRSEDGDRSAE